MKEPVTLKTPRKKSPGRVKFGSPVRIGEAFTPTLNPTPRKDSSKKLEVHKKNADWVSNQVEMDAIGKNDLIARNVNELVDKAIADSEAVVASLLNKKKRVAIGAIRSGVTIIE